MSNEPEPCLPVAIVALEPVKELDPVKESVLARFQRRNRFLRDRTNDFIVGVGTTIFYLVASPVILYYHAYRFFFGEFPSGGEK